MGAVAADLRVKGLTQNNSSTDHSSKQCASSPKFSRPPTPPERDPVSPPKRPRPAAPAQSYHQDDDVSGTIDPITGPSIQGAGGAEGIKAVVEMKMWKETTADRGLIWRCADCDYTAKLKRGMFEHVESKHVGSQGYTCLYCGKHCPSKNALRSHVSRKHPKS